MVAIERDNPRSKGVLPEGLRPPGARQAAARRSSSTSIANIGLGDGAEPRKDILGRVYEYFLGEFAAAEGKKGGQFYTPRCVVAPAGRDARAVQRPRLRSRAAAPAACSCSQREVRRSPRRPASATSPSTVRNRNPTTWRLAKMNLAIRGIEANLGKTRPTASTTTCTPT